MTFEEKSFKKKLRKKKKKQELTFFFLNEQMIEMSKRIWCVHA